MRPTADELAPVLRIAPKAASTLLTLARRPEDLPAAADAQAEGAMTYAQVRVTEQVTRDLPPGAATAAEATTVR